jgi:hypothetical protein
MRAQRGRRHQRVGKVDRCGRLRRRAEEKLGHARGPGVGAQQVPAPVDHEGRIRLLLRQHVVERAHHLRKLGRGERAFPPHRRETGGQQQRVLLAQRQVERRRQAQDHVAARRGAAGFQEAEMALGNLGGAGKRKLRLAAMGAPPAQARTEGGRRLHARR